jgi:succinate-semialdehyde dehydrogenase/glutarate-semialdehyde dehydrogenase
MPIATVSPATGETLRTFVELSDEDLERKVAAASAAFRGWRRTPLRDRIVMLRRAAQILEAEKIDLGRLMTTEMGKTHRSAIEEAVKCASGCRYYADAAETLLAPEIVRDEGRELGRIVFKPIGVVLAVMPWNFPFWQVVRFLAPALAAGNVALLKHSSNVPQCALALEDIFHRAGCPDGVFQALLIGSKRVGPLIDDRRIAAVSLTGSEPAGVDVASRAGRNIKRSVMELGGSDPFIVLASADVERAAKVAVTARTINNGQSCIAAKRFIVVEAVADRFTERFVEGMRALRVGDPMAPNTDVGPLASASIADDLEKQIAASVERGARILTGGKRLPSPGNWFEPTVLTDIPKDAPAYREELFGPVASLFRVKNADQALALANDTTFGLGASVWTTDRAEADRFIDEIESGQVFINSMVASDPHFPFGGVKRSGYGRELSSYGLREFVNVKTVRGDVGGSAGGHTGTE